MQNILFSVFAITFLFFSCCDDDGPKTCKESYETAVSTKNCASAPGPFPVEGEIFKVVEESPLFPGCDTVTNSTERRKCAEEKLLAFLKDNLVYPPSAIEEGLEGTVYVKFVVEEDGCVDGIEIVKSLGCGCAQESIRLVEMMPQWTPGKQRGTPVRVQFNLPVKFEL